MVYVIFVLELKQIVLYIISVATLNNIPSYVQGLI
jgi:hypothetical protein